MKKSDDTEPADQDRTESNNPMDEAYMSVANVNNEEDQHYEALHPEEASDHVYENQSVSSEAEGVTEPVEDDEYEETM